MAMGKVVKKALLVCAVLAALVCYQPLALLLSSMSPCIASQVDKSDAQDHGGNHSPQGWGLRKATAPAVRLLSGLLLQTWGVVQNKPLPFEPGAYVILAASGAQSAASSLAYLNNLSIRC